MEQAVTEVAWASGRVLALLRVQASDRVPAMAQVVVTGLVLASGRVAEMAGFAKGQAVMVVWSFALKYSKRRSCP